MSLNALMSLLGAILVLLIGTFVNGRVRLLSNYNIPDPITGGMLFAAAASLLAVVADFRISIDTTIKPLLAPDVLRRHRHDGGPGAAQKGRQGAGRLSGRPGPFHRPAEPRRDPRDVGTRSAPSLRPCGGVDHVGGRPRHGRCVCREVRRREQPAVGAGVDHDLGHDRTHPWRASWGDRSPSF